MNRKIKATILAVAFLAAGLGGVKAYNSYQVNNQSDSELLFVENLSALSDCAGGGYSKSVNCYCKSNWFSPNVCSANASGPYCGGDPCDQHDGNCR